MDGMTFVAAGTAACCFLGWLESRRHNQNLARIPIRIHVNGTRGKSGVTRLIAAGLRAGGISTFAKTTGTLARAIFPDGTEYPVFRPGRTNVIEQRRMVQIAVQQNVQAMVIECMALHPTLQSVSELKLVRSTHGVITNARADHLDVMGPTAEDVARALSSTTPVGGKLFTAEQKYLPVLAEAARDRGSDLIATDDDEVAEVSWDEVQRFPYVEHPENVALALRVCTDLGIDRLTALRGMWQATPDPGVMKVYSHQSARGPLTFVNGFAANDPESTAKIWHMMTDRYAECRQKIAIVNCRSDRQDRSVQMAHSAALWKNLDHVVLVGSATDVFERTAVQQGLKFDAVTSLEGQSASEIMRRIEGFVEGSAMVMGVGNTAGPGMELVDYFERQRPATPAQPSRRAKRRRDRKAAHAVTTRVLQEAA